MARNKQTNQQTYIEMLPVFSCERMKRKRDWNYTRMHIFCTNSIDKRSDWQVVRPSLHLIPSHSLTQTRLRTLLNVM